MATCLSIQMPIALPVGFIVVSTIFLCHSCASPPTQVGTPPADYIFYGEHQTWPDSQESLHIQPVGLRIDGNVLHVDLLLEGPESSTGHAAHIIVGAVVGNPSTWIEVKKSSGEPLPLFPYYDKHVRIHWELPDPERTVVVKAKRIMKTVVTVFAKIPEDLEDDTHVRYRLKPDAPYQERIDAIGSAPDIRQVIPDVRWY